jgi:hypothetical protein
VRDSLLDMGVIMSEAQWQEAYERMRHNLKALIAVTFGDGGKRFDSNINVVAVTRQAMDRVLKLKAAVQEKSRTAAPYYAVKLNAGDDINGNPRRGWLVYDRTGEFRGFVDEGYRGDRVLRHDYPGAVTLAVVPCPVTYYKESKCLKP